MAQTTTKKKVIRLTLPHKYKKHLDYLEKIYGKKTYTKTLMQLIDLDLKRLSK